MWTGASVQWDISAKELYPPILALRLWGADLRHGLLSFRSDNLAVVHIVNQLKSKDPIILSLLRQLAAAMLRLDLSIVATHVPGHKNSLADALSRLEVDGFRDKVCMAPS